MKAIVKKQFRDADEYVVDGVQNHYEVGQDVSHFDENRLKALQGRNLVSFVEEEPETDDKKGKKAGKDKE